MNEQQIDTTKLRQENIAAANNLAVEENALANAAHTPGLGHLAVSGSALHEAVKARRQELADSEHRAAEHYKANEGAYQEQALKDAAAANVRTNFGSD